MPNHTTSWEEITELRQEITRLKHDLRAANKALYEAGLITGQLHRERTETIASNAKLIYALDCAIIWAEALFAWLPAGTVMPPGIEAAKSNLSRALDEVRK